MRGVIDSAVDPVIEEIVFVAGTQVGKTAGEESIIGYWIDSDPGPLLIVRPTEESCGEYIKERLRPLIESSPSLRQHLSPNRDDNTLRVINLDAMQIYMGWSGSAGSLASRPCRFVVFDECDKFKDFSGSEADPISLAMERTATYGHRRRIIKTSTPTTAEGVIWKAFQACGDKRYYHVPCPHCGKYQRLVWSQVKWHKIESDKLKAADAIEQDGLAWYECAHCPEKIKEHHKPKMLEAGHWLSEGQAVVDGEVVGPRPRTKRVGFHLNSLYSPWRTFAAMAAEWLRADGDIGATMNFRNSRLAEPFEVQIATTDASAIKVRCRTERGEMIGPDADTVPEWASRIIATADVQADRLYYVLRAWGLGFRSQLLRYGCVLNFAELHRAVFQTPCILNGRHLFAEKLAIDGRYRKNEVVEFQKSDAGRIWRTLGLPHFNAPIAAFKVEQGGLGVVSVNTLLSKDRLSMLIGDADKSRWMPNKLADDDYLEQMASEHKIWDRDARREVWKQKTSGRDNHYWDCEANQCAIATLLHMDLPAERVVEVKPIVQPTESRSEPAGYLPDRPNWF